MELDQSPEAIKVRNSAMACHLAVLAGFVFPFGSLLGPLVVWLITRKESPIVDQHGKDAVNFQLSFVIYTILLIIVAVVIGVAIAIATVPTTPGHHPTNDPPAGLIVAVFGSVICMLGLSFVNMGLGIYAALKANRGERFRYPLAIPFLR